MIFCYCLLLAAAEVDLGVELYWEPPPYISNVVIYSVKQSLYTSMNLQ